jgi:hypothetical protein
VQGYYLGASNVKNFVELATLTNKGSEDGNVQQPYSILKKTYSNNVYPSDQIFSRKFCIH